MTSPGANSGRQAREAAQVDGQMATSRSAFARLDRHRRAANAVGDAGIEEARQVLCRSPPPPTATRRLRARAMAIASTAVVSRMARTLLTRRGANAFNSCTRRNRRCRWGPAAAAQA